MPGRTGGACYGARVELLAVVWWGLVSWLVAGLLLGVAVRLLPPWRGASWLATVALALLGALGAGLLATALGFGGLAALDLRSLAVAALGALLVALLFALLRVRRQLAAERPRPPLSGRGEAARRGARRPAG